MIQGGQDLRLSLKAAHALGIGGKLPGEDFQCQVPVQLGVLGTVDLAHTAFTDLLQDFVVADGCSDYGAIPLLGC